MCSVAFAASKLKEILVDSCKKRSVIKKFLFIYYFANTNSYSDYLDKSNIYFFCQLCSKYNLDISCRRYSLNDILILLVFVYSLLDETDIADHHERNLKVNTTFYTLIFSKGCVQ